MILAAVGVVRFVHHRAIGWVDAHVPIVVHPGGYDRVVADLERALDDAGWRSIGGRRPCRWPCPAGCSAGSRVPAIRSLVPDRPVDLVGHDLEVGLYPSDIAIGGKQAVVRPGPRRDRDPPDLDRGVDDDVGRGAGGRGDSRGA